MKALLRGGNCIVGCTLTRASRRLQKKQPPRRLPSPVTKRARDLQRAFKKQGQPRCLRVRDLQEESLARSCTEAGEGSSESSHKAGTGRYILGGSSERSGCLVLQPAGEGISSEIPQTGTPRYVRARDLKRGVKRGSRYLFGSGLAVRNAEPQDGERRQGQRERPFEAGTRRRLRGDRARITEVAAAEKLRVGIEDLFVDSARRYADAVSLAHHRREIAHA